MNIRATRFAYFLLLTSLSVLAQAPEKPGMRTYSPYTPEQLKEFNNQPISPVEGPMGPVEPNSRQMDLTKPSFNSKFYYRPEGEEEAEAQETESAQPFQPTSPIMTF